MSFEFKVLLVRHIKLSTAIEQDRMDTGMSHPIKIHNRIIMDVRLGFVAKPQTTRLQTNNDILLQQKN